MNIEQTLVDQIRAREGMLFTETEAVELALRNYLTMAEFKNRNDDSIRKIERAMAEAAKGLGELKNQK